MAESETPKWAWGFPTNWTGGDASDRSNSDRQTLKRPHGFFSLMNFSSNGKNLRRAIKNTPTVRTKSVWGTRDLTYQEFVWPNRWFPPIPCRRIPREWWGFCTDHQANWGPATPEEARVRTELRQLKACFLKQTNSKEIVLMAFASSSFPPFLSF